MLGNRQNVADQHVFEVLGFTRSLTHGEDGRSRSYGIGNSNERLLGNVPTAGARQGKDPRPYKCECQAKPIGATAVGIHSDQNGDGGAQGGDLRQRKIHENDAAFHHMHAQVGVDAGKDKTGEKRGQQKWKNFHSPPRELLSNFLEAFDQKGNVIVEELEVVCDLLFPAHRGQQDQHLASHCACNAVWRFQVEVGFHHN